MSRDTPPFTVTHTNGSIAMYRHPRIVKQFLNICASTDEYLTASELSLKCGERLSAKRVARLIRNLEADGYVFYTRRRSSLCREYRLTSPVLAPSEADNDEA